MGSKEADAEEGSEGAWLMSATGDGEVSVWDAGEEFADEGEFTSLRFSSLRALNAASCTQVKGVRSHDRKHVREYRSPALAQSRDSAPGDPPCKLP